jgi:hypothetical protein
MADNVTLNTMTGGSVVGTDEVTDGTLGTVQIQYVKLMDGTLNGTSKAAVGANGLRVNIDSDTVPVTGTFWQATQPVSIASTALTDGSTTITAGGTAQTAFAAAAVVNGYEIINPDASSDLWISDTTTAAANGTGSIRIVANGGGYTSPAGMKPSAAVSIVGATTGQKFTARRW